MSNHEPLTRYYPDLELTTDDDENGIVTISMKSYQDGPWVAHADYARDIKALGEGLTTLRQEQLATQRTRIAEVEAERDTLQAQLTEANRLLGEYTLEHDDEAHHSIDPREQCDCEPCVETRTHLNPPKESTDGP